MHDYNYGSWLHADELVHAGQSEIFIVRNFIHRVHLCVIKDATFYCSCTINEIVLISNIISLMGNTDPWR